jgi:glucan phosphoethanolaminetransferase (alkaline phosphatase superfamily)
MIKKIIIIIFVLLTGFSYNYSTVYALDKCTGSDTKICETDTNLVTDIIKSIINIILVFAGILAVLMIVIGGIRYITSDGDSSRASQAKNTILYAIIGLIVAILSYAIVNFVLTNI